MKDLRETLYDTFKDEVPPPEEQHLVFVGRELPRDVDHASLASFFSLVDSQSEGEEEDEIYTHVDTNTKATGDGGNKAATGEKTEEEGRGAGEEEEVHANKLEVVVLRRRQVEPPPEAKDGGGAVKPLTASEISRALEEEREIAAAEDEPLHSPPHPGPGLGSSGEMDPVETTLRALVQGNFEQLREYMEQIQESMAVRGMPGAPIGSGYEFSFGEDPLSDEEDNEDNEDERLESGFHGGQDEDSTEHNDEDNLLSSVPDVRESRALEPDPSLLSELIAMGFDEALSRNALLLSRNVLPLAIEWALDNADEPEARQPPEESLIAFMDGVLGPPTTQNSSNGDSGGSNDGVDSPHLQAMMEMGFSREVAAFALQMAEDRLDDACQFAVSFLNFFGDSHGEGGLEDGAELRQMAIENTFSLRHDLDDDDDDEDEYRGEEDGDSDAYEDTENDNEDDDVESDSGSNASSEAEHEYREDDDEALELQSASGSRIDFRLLSLEGNANRDTASEVSAYYDAQPWEQDCEHIQNSENLGDVDARDDEVDGLQALVTSTEESVDGNRPTIRELPSDFEDENEFVDDQDEDDDFNSIVDSMDDNASYESGDDSSLSSWDEHSDEDDEHHDPTWEA